MLALAHCWPETMRLELHACRTPEAYLAWSEKWGEQLSGRAARDKIRELLPDRPGAGAFRHEAADASARRLAL